MKINLLSLWIFAEFANYYLLVAFAQSNENPQGKEAEDGFTDVGTAGGGVEIPTSGSSDPPQAAESSGGMSSFGSAAVAGVGGAAVAGGAAYYLMNKKNKKLRRKYGDFNHPDEYVRPTPYGYPNKYGRNSHGQAHHVTVTHVYESNRLSTSGHDGDYGHNEGHGHNNGGHGHNSGGHGHNSGGHGHNGNHAHHEHNAHHGDDEH